MKMPRSRKKPTEQSMPQRWRRYAVVIAMLSVFTVLGLRVGELQITERGHLQQEGEARHLRHVTVAPSRGQILDRFGRVLAVSTPVDSIWAEPRKFCAAQTRSQWHALIMLAEVGEKKLHSACNRHAQGNFPSDFMYIRRHLPPMLAAEIRALQIPGVGVQQEYKRFYPSGAAGAHLIGFTDVDDIGQEGLERVFQKQLAGDIGRIGALKDRAGNFVEYVENIQPVRHGADLSISIDRRVQSLASDYLESAVRKHQAAGGSVVVLAVPSGEILAMVNSPQFNPNDRRTLINDAVRNRSVTDVMEPGSTAKPFTVAMALESDEFDAETEIQTSPGYLQLGKYTIHDLHDYGTLTVTDVLAHSSNVGITKIARALPYQKLFNTFGAVGFGSRSAKHIFAGESAGSLKPRNRPVEHAALSYGYGVSVTALQLARAYTVFATDGELLPITLTPRHPNYRARGKRVFSAETVQTMRKMLTRAASSAGTARKAQIPRYAIGGKTGTTHKFIDGEYQEDRYVSVFAGIAPINAPKFVAVVSVDDPRGKFYYGGDVAAPVFAELMKDLMRLYNIKPDAPTSEPAAEIALNDAEF